jgi:hypothetical protein
VGAMDVPGAGVGRGGSKIVVVDPMTLRSRGGARPPRPRSQLPRYGSEPFGIDHG